MKAMVTPSDHTNRARDPQDHSFTKRRRSLVAMMSMLMGRTVRKYGASVVFVSRRE